MRKYTITTIPQVSNTQVPSNCNWIEFKNQGNTIVFVEGMQLYPGQAWSPTPTVNPEWTDVTSYNVRFVTADVASPSNNLMVSRLKFQ